jgi:hypothetical protein
MARDGAASRPAVRRVSSPDASRRPVGTVSPSQIALRDGGARARRLVARRRGGALLTGLHTDLCTGARAKKPPKMALRARRAENKKAHTGVAVWAFTLSRYRAGGLLSIGSHTQLKSRILTQSQSVFPTVDTTIIRLQVSNNVVTAILYMRWAKNESKQEGGDSARGLEV